MHRDQWARDRLILVQMSQSYSAGGLVNDNDQGVSAFRSFGVKKMVTTILSICIFSLTGLYMIAGSIASYKLSNHIEYTGGFLKLWNVTQLYVMSFGKLDYSLDNAQANEIFASLKR